MGFGFRISRLVFVVADMSPSSAKILLTGPPGCGKTTAVVRIVERLDSHKAAGFYTQEIRDSSKRVGFRWRRLGGVEGILAHVNIKSRYKVGRYGVDIAEFERSVVPVLDAERAGIELFVIDEIGKMECLSKKFVDAVRLLLASDKCVLATVAQKGTGFIQEVKSRPDVTLLNLTRARCAETIDEILQALPFVTKT